MTFAAMCLSTIVLVLVLILRSRHIQIDLDTSLNPTSYRASQYLQLIGLV